MKTNSLGRRPIGRYPPEATLWGSVEAILSEVDTAGGVNGYRNGVDLRRAAFAIGIERVARASRMRGYV